MAWLAIDRLRLQLQSRAHASRAAAIEARLSDVARHRLPAELQRLEVSADGSAPMVFIDELQVQAVLATAWDDERLARTLAHALAQRLQWRLQAPPGDGLRCFASRADWLAEFMLALVQGQAWRRWWFRALDGLAALPVTAALRTLIEAEGDDAIQALLRLTPSAEALVWQNLGDADACRLLATWSRREAAARVPLPALLQAAQALPGSGLPGLPGVLRGAMALQSAHPGSLGRRTLTLLAALADELHAREVAATATGPAGWQDGLDAAERQQWAGWREPGGPLAPQATRSEAAPAASTGTTTLHTRHGGALVLMTVLDWLRWPARWQEVLPGDAETAAQLSRAMSLDLIARCLQPRAPAQVRTDPALCTLWQVQDLPDLLRRHGPSLRAANRAVPGPRPAEQLLRALATRVPGCAQSSARYLRDNLLSMPATVALDAEAGVARVRLGRAPLHVLLLIAGLASSRWTLGSWRVDIASEDK
ncbi:MAG: hypothetical protein KF720_14475 [Rubrivivax sp.]|nr:hypothetical protein [Rubrivivax sp.]